MNQVAQATIRMYLRFFEQTTLGQGSCDDVVNLQTSYVQLEMQVGLTTNLLKRQLFRRYDFQSHFYPDTRSTAQAMPNASVIKHAHSLTQTRSFNRRIEGWDGAASPTPSCTYSKNCLQFDDPHEEGRRRTAPVSLRPRILIKASSKPCRQQVGTVNTTMEANMWDTYVRR